MTSELEPPYPVLPVAPQTVERSLAHAVYEDEAHRITVGEVLDRLLAAGMSVYAAGGAPRDWLLDETPNDVDLYVDQPLETVHALLRDAYPGIDPARRKRPRGFLLRWGNREPGLDICILRAPGDIRGGDAWTTEFPVRDDVRQNARMMDFSFHTYHYDFRRGVLLDPLGHGTGDLMQRRLCLSAAPAVLAATYWPTPRVIQFEQRGFIATAATRAYLEANADRDIAGMGERLGRWIPAHISERENIVNFVQRLKPWLRDAALHRLLDRLLDDLCPPQASGMDANTTESQHSAEELNP